MFAFEALGLRPLLRGIWRTDSALRRRPHKPGDGKAVVLPVAGCVRRSSFAPHCSHTNAGWLRGTTCTCWQTQHLAVVVVGSVLSAASAVVDSEVIRPERVRIIATSTPK